MAYISIAKGYCPCCEDHTVTRMDLGHDDFEYYCDHGCEVCCSETEDGKEIWDCELHDTRGWL